MYPHTRLVSPSLLQCHIARIKCQNRRRVVDLPLKFTGGSLGTTSAKNIFWPLCMHSIHSLHTEQSDNKAQTPDEGLVHRPIRSRQLNEGQKILADWRRTRDSDVERIFLLVRGLPHLFSESALVLGYKIALRRVEAPSFSHRQRKSPKQKC